MENGGKSFAAATSILSHVQIGYANIAINNSYGNGFARNLLVHDTLTAVNSATGGTNRFEHATLHRVGTFRTAGVVLATNCLFIGVTNSLVFTGSNVETNLSDVGVFQTVGAGSRYLNKASCRGAGTTNINPALLAALRQRTTYPPLVLSGDIVSDTTLYPRTRRDTTTFPDLGFHYDCLNCCWSGLTVSNATLRLQPGIAVAVYGTNGLWLRSGAKFISQGTPTAMNRLTRYNTVQEEPMNWGPTAGTMGLFRVPHITTPPYTTMPKVRLRCTEVSLLADTFAESHIVADLTAYVLGALEIKDSVIRGGFFDIRPTCSNPYVSETIGLTNSLFQRGTYCFNAAYYNDMTPVVMRLRNNLIKDSTFSLNNLTNTTTWTAHDNLFDAVTLSGPANATGLLVNTHNGYLGTTVLVETTFRGSCDPSPPSIRPQKEGRGRCEQDFRLHG